MVVRDLDALRPHVRPHEAHPELVIDPDRVLAAPIHRDRRGEYMEGKAPTYAAPVFCYHAGYMTVTFVRRFVESAPRHPGVPPVTPALVEAMDLLEQLAESDDLRLDMDFRAGDIQWINNLTTFHSRTEYEDWPEPERKRHLYRLWINDDAHARPMPDVFRQNIQGIWVEGVVPQAQVDVAKMVS